MSSPTIWLVLPAYNEERSLPALLERCVPVAQELERSGARLAVLVVDDGSRDRTAAAANAFAGRLQIEVIPHGVNQGLGAALRTGLLGAIERAAEPDHIATMDADNTHDPGLLSAMARRLDEESADLVIASRYTPGGKEVGLTALRRVLSRGASFLLSVVAPVRGARDYTCGYRLYRGALLKRAATVWGERLVEEAGFTCMAEVLLKLGRGGARVTEHPLVLRYDLKEGASKMKVMRTISRYIVLAQRIRTRPVPRLHGAPG
ncbi:MAG TPA: glycosyltransferase family 2 protein [Candidatus Limnocylindria bacterium]|nr:glycosyltransferase family 2 protein [Candidatus Limnocylindria bacterium]